MTDMLLLGLVGLLLGFAAGYWFGWKDGCKDRDYC